jgi:hypothetical protein
VPLGPETSFLLARVALESPTFAQISFSGVYMTVTQVEPLKLVSIVNGEPILLCKYLENHYYYSKIIFWLN